MFIFWILYVVDCLVLPNFFTSIIQIILIGLFRRKEGGDVCDGYLIALLRSLMFVCFSNPVIGLLIL